jgi:hypothetical protein
MMSKLEFIPFADKMVQGDWRVEAIDEKSGDAFIAIFSGPECDRLANEYAAFKNGKHPAAKPAPEPAAAPAPISKDSDLTLFTLADGEQLLVSVDDVSWTYGKQRRCLKGVPKPAIQRLGVKGKA